MNEDCPFCRYEKSEENCRGCFEGSNYRPKQTNADRIRSMTGEELADMFVDIAECDRRCPAKLGDCIFSDSSCRSAWLDWLKQEADHA